MLISFSDFMNFADGDLQSSLNNSSGHAANYTQLHDQCKYATQQVSGAEVGIQQSSPTADSRFATVDLVLSPISQHSV